LGAYWVPIVVFVVHIAEECWLFPAWATRHFGTTSRAWYVYSHIVLVVLAALICARAQAGTSETIWRVLSTSIQWALATNAIFHVSTTVLFREYSPGLFTGIFIVLPATVYLFNRALTEGHLTLLQVALGVGLGTLVGAAVVLSLWMDMGLDWRLCRLH
jgi:hypothetical protein